MSEQLFTPSNDLTFATVQQDSLRMLKLLRDHEVTSIRFHLCDVTHCDSAGLALLIEAKRLCKQYHKLFIIDGMPKAISALAEFCGVETMLEQ